MQAPRDDLAPPKEDPYTTEELKAYDGSDPTKPIYVAIKGVCRLLCLSRLLARSAPRNRTDVSLGTIFDVSNKVEVYGLGKSYSIFAGKDGSRGLGMSSLKPEDAVADYSTLDTKDRKVLEDWHAFFS